MTKSITTALPVYIVYARLLNLGEKTKASISLAFSQGDLFAYAEIFKISLNLPEGNFIVELAGRTAVFVRIPNLPFNTPYHCTATSLSCDKLPQEISTDSSLPNLNNLHTQTGNDFLSSFSFPQLRLAHQPTHTHTKSPFLIPTTNLRNVILSISTLSY